MMDDAGFVPEADGSETMPLLKRVVRQWRQSWAFRAAVIVCGTALLVLVALIIVYAATVWSRGPPEPLRVVVMLADGMGPASVSLARAFQNATGGRGRLWLDDLLVGSVQTASLDSRVTDSGAGATAYSCGLRTFNNRVGVSYDNKACGTLMEAAKRAGMRVGVVVKSTLSHATPGAWTAHASLRWDEQFIASQQIALGVDVLFGGGRDIYAFNYGGKPSPLQVAETMGYTIVSTNAEMAALSSVPALGLFASGMMDYEIDRQRKGAQSTEPTLEAMARKALELLLAADTDNKGIMLFVEGSFIDTAGHENDAAAQVRETLGYDATAKFVADWARRTPNALFLGVSDHATGGLALGLNAPGPKYPDPYAFFVRELVKADMSLESVAKTLGADAALDLATFVSNHTGFALDAAQVQYLSQWRATDWERFARELGLLVSHSGDFGWTTWGHDAVDVPLYAAGAHKERFGGSQRNDDIGQQLADIMGLVDLQKAVTESLANFNAVGHPNGWTGGNAAASQARAMPRDRHHHK